MRSSCQDRRPTTGAPTYCGGIGRPADVEVLADGSMLVTDEMNSIVLRVRYTGAGGGGDGGPAGEEGSFPWVLVPFGVAVLAALAAAIAVLCRKREKSVRLLDVGTGEDAASEASESLLGSNAEAAKRGSAAE